MDGKQHKEPPQAAVQLTSIHCLIRAGLPSHTTASKSHGGHPYHETWRDQRRSVSPFSSTLTTFLIQKRTLQPASQSCWWCLLGVAALQVVCEAEWPPSPSPVENITSLRSINSYKVPELQLKYRKGVHNTTHCLFSHNNRNQMLKLPVTSLHITHPNTCTAALWRGPNSQKAFDLFFWKWWRWWCPSFLCVSPWTCTHIIHTKPGHCQAIVRGYSVCALFYSVSPCCPILISIIK